MEKLNTPLHPQDINCDVEMQNINLKCNIPNHLCIS